MKVVRTIIGNTEVLIRALDDDSSIEEIGSNASSEGSLKNTQKTGIKENLNNAFEKAKDTIFNIVDVCDEELKARDKKPNEMELEFTMSFSAKGDIWVIGCEGTNSLKVSLKWNSK